MLWLYDEKSFLVFSGAFFLEKSLYICTEILRFLEQSCDNGVKNWFWSIVEYCSVSRKLRNSRQFNHDNFDSCIFNDWNLINIYLNKKTNVICTTNPIFMFFTKHSLCVAMCCYTLHLKRWMIFVQWNLHQLGFRPV